MLELCQRSNSIEVLLRTATTGGCRESNAGTDLSETGRLFVHANRDRLPGKSKGEHQADDAAPDNGNMWLGRAVDTIDGHRRGEVENT